MTSSRQVKANRRNAKRSTGPHTATGKRRSSRNALRHGLSAGPPGSVVTDKRFSQLVSLIIGESSNPIVAEQAAIVAEAQMQIELIRRARIAAIERTAYQTAAELRGLPSARKIGETFAESSASSLAKSARLLRGISCRLRTAASRLARCTDKPSEKQRQAMEMLLSAHQWAQRRKEPHELLLQALPELGAFDRYERRAISRRRRAMNVIEVLAPERAAAVPSLVIARRGI